MSAPSFLWICLIGSLLQANFATAGNVSPAVPPQAKQHQATMPDSSLPQSDKEDDDVIIMEEDENFEEGDMEKQDDDDYQHQNED
jgi:hypothetical protein